MSPDYDSYSEKLNKLRQLRWFSAWQELLRALSPAERLALYILTILFCGSTLVLLGGANASVSTLVPSEGGALVEGVVGPARFINPVLALSQPDEDLSTLVYSGLTRALPDGSIVPDLASSYEISEDGTVYTFTLRSDARFHNGTPVTAEDIVFTTQRAKDPDIRSPRRADWEGVSVSNPDEHTIVFKLPHAYAPFLENTTLGILPKSLWEDVAADEFPFSPLNTHPVGSGPYKVVDFGTDSTGAPTRYELSSFGDFTLGKAFLKKITFVFFSNEQELISAFNAGRIDSFAGVSPSNVSAIKRTDARIVRTPLPRVFGVFFNQGKNAALADLAARRALDAAIDKEQIVNEVLEGFGVVLDGPIPPGILGGSPPRPPVPIGREEQATTTSDGAEAAKRILSNGGWKFDDATGVWKKGKTVFEFTLATADEPELSASAEKAAAAWRAAGIKVDVHVYPLSELNSLVLRPRSYEAVLFGEVVGRTVDLFAFWHSSQRNDPGLNLALYANSKTDALLASARAATDAKKRAALYEQFASLVEKDRPAVFLYAPEFIYVVPSALKGVALGTLTTPGERFLDAYEWYTDTERVWDIFTNY